MKKAYSFLSLCLSSFVLTGCSLFIDDGKWKDNYGTPELFLESISEDDHRESIFLYDNNSNDIQDENYQIKKMILSFSPFEKITKKHSETDRYFTYQAYWQPATSGPNYCTMSIWDDGFIKIDHKKSLGPHGYAYFQMDADKALILNDFVFSLITVDDGGIE